MQPGNQEHTQPGNQESMQPSNKEPTQPSIHATRNPRNQATKNPRNLATKNPHNQEPTQPGNQEHTQPGNQKHDTRTSQQALPNKHRSKLATVNQTQSQQHLKKMQSQQLTTSTVEYNCADPPTRTGDPSVVCHENKSVSLRQRACA